MIARVRLKTTESKSQSITPATTRKLALFGAPLLLEGEDAAAYDELLTRICAAVKPIDIIDEMFIADVVSLEWEVLRWRKLKLGLMRELGLEALENFLVHALDDDLYAGRLTELLAEYLQNNLPEDEADSAPTLAQEYLRNVPDAIEKLANMMLAGPADMNQMIADARAEQAHELMQQYVRGEPAAASLVRKLLTRANLTSDGLIANALVEKFDEIERFDRLTAIAESRRNASLREIDRRRAVLGQKLHQAVQEIEDAEFTEIGATTAKGKKAA